jgi:hypothetical protein
VKVGRERPEVSGDRYRCVACHFDLRCALAAHHRVPKEHGGRDTLVNLTTLCANCHKAVHWFSVEGRLSGLEGDKARRFYSASALAKLTELAEAIRDQRLQAKRAGNQWLKRADTEGPMPLADALDLVSRRNHLDQTRTGMLRQVTERVLHHLAAGVLKGCSIRLVQRGRFLSVNAGNILLFRTPGVFDGIREADGDVLLIWPEGTRLSVLPKDEWREIEQGEGRFAALPCFNLPLEFKQVLGMSKADWRAFTNACLDAVRLGKSRQWVSNVVLPDVPSS